MKKLILISSLIFSGCVTCLKEDDFNKIMPAGNLESVELKHLDGEYKCIKFTIFGDEMEVTCSTFIKNGVIKHHSGKTITIKNPEKILSDPEVYEFTDKKIKLHLN